VNTEIIPHEDNVLSIHQIVELLKSYQCPKHIIDELEEWKLQLFLDKVKLEKWHNKEGI